MVSLIASLVAMMATPVVADQRRERRHRDDRPRLHVEIDREDRQSRREWRRERREGRRERRERRREHRIGSSVPEPTAALLFAGGGLIVAQAIRSNRRKQRK